MYVGTYETRIQHVLIDTGGDYRKRSKLFFVKFYYIEKEFKARPCTSTLHKWVFM